MASAGLKRSSSSDVPPHSDISSPFWPSNKRRCTTNYSPPNSSNCNLQQLQMHNQHLQQSPHQQHHQQQHHQQHQQRPFRDPAQILGSLSDEVTSMIKNEINKQHHHNNHHHHHHQPSTPNQASMSSPHHNLQQQQHQLHHNQPHASSSPPSSASPSAMDTPILSYRQTQHICEEVIRKREQRLREEYDKILINKLAEQYETFVKYTQDHIERRYNEENSHQASYLS